MSTIGSVWSNEAEEPYDFADLDSCASKPLVSIGLGNQNFNACFPELHVDPSRLRTLQPAWSTCEDLAAIVYDPPSALQSMLSLDGPTTASREPSPRKTAPATTKAGPPILLKPTATSISTEDLGVSVNRMGSSKTIYPNIDPSFKSATAASPNDLRSSKDPLRASSTARELKFLGQTLAISKSPIGGLVTGSLTLESKQPVATISGTTVSPASDALVVGTSTMAFDEGPPMSEKSATKQNSSPISSTGISADLLAILSHWRGKNGATPSTHSSTEDHASETQPLTANTAQTSGDPPPSYSTPASNVPASDPLPAPFVTEDSASKVETLTANTAQSPGHSLFSYSPSTGGLPASNQLSGNSAADYTYPPASNFISASSDLSLSPGRPNPEIESGTRNLNNLTGSTGSGDQSISSSAPTISTSTVNVNDPAAFTNTSIGGQTSISSTPIIGTSAAIPSNPTSSSELDDQPIPTISSASVTGILLLPLANSSLVPTSRNATSGIGNIYMPGSSATSMTHQCIIARYVIIGFGMVLAVWLVA
ncbi:hypothetical protein MMC20_003836 [Loxospora ochrophaea]|nr:hypothetical protein [Loxospora ochrophaea]